jgi:hypothetical protein
MSADVNVLDLRHDLGVNELVAVIEIELLLIIVKHRLTVRELRCLQFEQAEDLFLLYARVLAV